MTAPVSSPPDGCKYRPYHADERKQADDRIEPSDDEVGEKYPIERHALGLEMPVEVLFLILLLFHVAFYFFLVQNYKRNNRNMNGIFYLCIDFIYYGKLVRYDFTATEIYCSHRPLP